MAACPNTKRAYFQLRRGNAAYWAANGGTVLREGEPAYNTTTNQLKIGYKNVVTGADQTWDQLPYMNPVYTPSSLVIGPGVIAATLVDGSLPSNSSLLTINPIPFTLAPNVPIQFTNITSVFTTSSESVANNTTYYIKTLSSQTQFTISSTSGGTEIVFNV